MFGFLSLAGNPDRPSFRLADFGYRLITTFSAFVSAAFANVS